MKKNIKNDKINAFLRVRSYMRYSSTQQDDGFSIEYQTAEINEYINRNGMELTKAHIDTALTASKNIEKREAFFELVRDVQSGFVDVIVVYKMSRMFRNAGESYYYRRIFQKHGVKILSVTEHIDDESSSGRLTTNILATIDQYQSEVISEHVRSGMREAAKQGLFTGQRVLIGYDLEEIKHGSKKRKRFVINEEEAKFIRRLFEMYASGLSFRQISKILKSEGIKTKQNAEFSENTLRRMLKNDFYNGFYRYSTKGYDDICIHLPELQIIDDALFHAVQEMRTSKNPDLKPRYGKRYYSLTGKTICGKCGNHYIGTSTQQQKYGVKKHYNYYTCKERKEFSACDGLNVRKEFIENEVLKAIRENILKENKIKELSNQIAEICKQSPQDLNDQLKEAKAKEKSLKKKYDLFIDSFLDESEKENKNNMSNTMLKIKLNEIETELTEAQKRVKVLNEQLQFAITPDSIAKFLNDMLRRSESADEEILKSVFDTFVDKIIVNDDDVEIHLRVYPSEFISHNDSLGLPFVTLSEKLERPIKYKPRSRVK